MDEQRLELYQVRDGMCKEAFVADVAQNQMDEVVSYFARNGMGFEEKEGTFKVTSPFLKTAVKELGSQLKIEFVEQIARLVK